jgi:hypothetical protein
VLGWSSALTLVVLAPAIGPGFVLRADLVAVPQQVLLPAWLGLGGGLPRAVPQDAVVAILDDVIPGGWLQSLLLVAALLAAGTGAGRLLRRAPLAAQLVAATGYLWSPYVAERLLIGHVGLLLAYGLAPWALDAALAVRRGERGLARLVLLLGLGALVPSGGVLVAAVAVPVAALGGRSTRATRWLAVGAAVLMNAPWWLPSVLHPQAGVSDPDGGPVFALRPEGDAGALLTALGRGGLWNAFAVPGSRDSWLAIAGTVLALCLAAAGATLLRRHLGRSGVWLLGGLSAAGLAWAVLGVWFPDAAGAVVASVPGAGLLRDAQKWLAPWSLLVSVAAGLGAARVAAAVARRGGEPVLGPATVGTLMLLLIVVLPDLAGGVAGRLTQVDFPRGWLELRGVLAERTEPGDVVVLPWSAYRQPAWNDEVAVLDPMPRLLTRTTIVDDGLVVLDDGVPVRVSGEDPRAVLVGAAVEAGELRAEDLRAWGVGWVVVQPDAAGAVPERYVGLREVRLPPAAAGEGLRLLGVPGGADPEPWRAGPVRTALVVGTDLLALAVLLGAAARTTSGYVHRRRSLLSSSGPTGR